MTTRKGFHLDDNSPVSQAEALQAWAPIAADELISTARTYDAAITYKELALRVREVSGVRTTQLIMHCIGRLLDDVAAAARNSGEPPLTALCVRADGTVGDGYGGDDSSAQSRELLAAEERLLCYERYATDLPEGGGEPNISPITTRQRQTQPVAPAKTQVTCPNCFVVVPATGTCGVCGWSPTEA